MVEDYLAELIKEAKGKSTTPEKKEQGIEKASEEKKIESEAKAFRKHLAEEEQIARTIKPSDISKEKITPLDLKQQEASEKEYSTDEDFFAKSEKEEIDSYGKVKIFKIPEKPLKFYYVPTVKPTPQERRIINTLKEVTTRLISISPFKIRDPEQRRIIYKQKVLEIMKNSPNLKIPETKMDFYADAVVREMVGYGLIDDLIKDDQLEEIMVIAPKKPVYVFHRKHEMMITNIEFIDEQEIEDLINRIGREVGRRVDVASPLLDARLPDGSRVNATIPPASISGGTLTIRKFKADPYSIIDLIKEGTVNSEVAAFLWICVEGMNARPANMLIAGGTGSGKTTLLNVLSSFIPERERIITIEDTAELSLPIEHWIRMEARPPGLEGTGELKMDILVKNALRMRPDRIIVGEIRHSEAFTFFTAINTGHDGCLGTVHANSPEETIIRVTNPPMEVPEIMLSGLDFIIMEHRYHDAKKGTIRRVSAIAEVTGSLSGKTQTRTIYQRDPVKDTLERTLVNSEYLSMLQAFTGLTKEGIEKELNERKLFLEKLLKNNIRSFNEVSKATKKFLQERRNLNE